MRPPIHPLRKGRRGLSLVVVVALLGLLSLLAVSLLSMVTMHRQTSYLEAESRKTELLARSAFNTVLADLTDEMNKGAASIIENKLKDGSIIRRYDFTGKPEGMRVTRAAKSAEFDKTTLVKQSASGVPFHTQGGEASKRASAESTAAGSDPLDPSIWQKPRLLDESFSLSETESPDWIYISRDGGNPTSFSDELKQDLTAGESNMKFVIGRYAYNLYDTSGLLDINAAGHPEDGLDDKRIGQKGSLATADLAGIPGMDSAAASALASRRHDWSSNIPVTKGATGRESDYISLSEGSGWKTLAANDNLFLSRQDMLRFAKIRPDSLPDAALPHFTSFSRDLDAPSWRPDPNRPKTRRGAEQGGNDAYGQDDVLNPDPMTFDETRERRLLSRRFPLERLRYVATPGSAGPIDPSKAERYFGLRWADTGWEYIHSRPDGRMYTLQDIPEGREPNFFEILRASVLVGSLGRQFGARGWDDLDQRLSMHQLPNGGIGGIDSSVNLNIMEMGACIIDQYDSDSYPTSIAIVGGSRPYTVYGKEDVPYITRLSAIPYRGDTLRVRVYDGQGKPAKSDCFEASMVLQPMLWRPHQIVENYDGPTKFRIRPRHIDQGGGSMFYMSVGWAVPGKGSPPEPNRTNAGDYSYWGGPNYRNTEPENFPKTFTGSDYLEIGLDPSSTAFREPQSVSSPAHGAIAGYSIGGNVAAIPVRSGDLRWNGLPNSYKEVSGFLVGHGITANFTAAEAGQPRLKIGYFRGDPIEVMMEYQGSDNRWHPYEIAEFTYKSNWGDHYIRGGADWDTEAFHWSSYLVDPRTSRFGGLATVMAGGIKTNEWNTLDKQMTWPEGCALAFGSGRGVGVRPGWTGPAANTGWNYNGNINYISPYNPAGVVDNNKVSWSEQNTFAYLDPDDILRPGVAGVNEYGSVSVGNPMSRRGSLSNTGNLSINPASLIGRPRILNRPFRSVAELAYSFRGTPWRDIDFLNPTSPDSGLLDVFSLYENPDEIKAGDSAAPIVAGRVNLNSASVETLAALLRGTALDENEYLSKPLAEELAKQVHDWLRGTGTGQGPLSSIAGLVSNMPPDGKASGLAFEISGKLASAEDRSINDRREFIVRALSGGTTVRAWDFMLDLVVQSGRLTSSVKSLANFNVTAERRYWVHFAIDRPTGKVLDVQWEPVRQ